MKEIKLYSGKVALVDDADFDMLSTIKWYDHVTRIATYARASKSGNYMLMHRLIMQADKGLVVDHINGNTLDNRRSNLRTVTQKTNTHNRQYSSTETSAYLGISKPKNKTYWVAYVGDPLLGNIRLGSYPTEKEAMQARDRYIVTYGDTTSQLNQTREEVLADITEKKNSFKREQKIN